MSWNTLPPELREAALRELTPKQLRVFQHRIKPMSYRDIAIVLNISEATVRGHYDAALRRLQPYLEEAA